MIINSITKPRLKIKLNQEDEFLEDLNLFFYIIINSLAIYFRKGKENSQTDSLDSLLS